MLIIWCSSDPALIRKTLGPVISRQPVDHRVEPDTTQVPPHSPTDTILACGAKALDVLIKAGLAPKNRTVTSLRDGALPGSQEKFFVTFDPGITNKDYARLPEIQWDCQLAIRKVLTGSVAPVLGRYKYVDSLHEIIEYVEETFEKTGRKVPISADLETKGLDEYLPGVWIICASFTHIEGQSQVLYFSKHEKPLKPVFVEDGTPVQPLTYWQALWVQIEWLLTSPKVALRGANFKFDSRWLNRHWSIDPVALTTDTVLIGTLLDENRSNSLKLHAKLYTPLGGYEDDMKDTYEMGSLENVPKPVMLNYVGGDSDATQRSAAVLIGDLVKDPKLTKFYQTILQPSSRVFEKMERTGVCVDVPYYHQLQEELETEIARLDKEMKSLIPGKLRAKYADNFSLTRPALMREFLFTPAGLNLKPVMFTASKGDPSTTLDHLSTFKDEPAAATFIALMEEIGSARKTKSTYVDGFLKHLRSDGRFHPSYMLFSGAYHGGGDDSGAVTGRTSCKDPAMQCLRGDSLVTTNKGSIAINCIVSRVEAGESFQVLTHIGQWRRVVGVYRNGVKPVFSVKTERATLVSTANHPYLTARGWVRTDQLQPGDTCYEVRPSNDVIHQPHLAPLGTCEEPLQYRSSEGTGPRYKSWIPSLPALDWDAYGASVEEGLPIERGCFQETRIESIQAAGEEETFDLTIESSHSFVANSLVVHNTIPKHTKWTKRLRRAFVPPPGKTILQIDYSQGELKITACLAEEPTMIQAYANGIDLHAVTAAQLNGYELSEFMALPEDMRDELRSGGKAGNFGLIYGMQSAGFRDYAWSSYGVSMTEAEAVAKREAFFTLYIGLVKWHETSKGFAKRWGYVRSPLGRIRHLPLITSPDREARSQAERQAVNSPVQSCLSDMMQLAMVLIDLEYGHTGDVEMWLMCHDACGFYVPTEDATIWAKRLKAIMDNLPLKEIFGWDHQLQFTTDAEICNSETPDGVMSFAYLKKLKGL